VTPKTLGAFQARAAKLAPLQRLFAKINDEPVMLAHSWAARGRAREK
jgi:hypothetical protein